jgi:NADPH:quinone reductase-like Zn-dependent oxidoreductase
MRQAVQSHFQSISHLRVVEAEKPSPKPGEILVKVEATGVNPVDWKLAEGYMNGAINISMPYVPGCDISGTVEQLGEGVTHFRTGDAIYGYPSLLRGGGYAEYIIMLENEMAIAPRGIPLREAAAYPVASCTAYEGLFVYGKLARGMRLLVLGGAGGVGSAAVQLAKRAGAEVFATGSAAKKDYLEGLGAIAIDYGAGPVGQFIRDVDFIFDTIGGVTALGAIPTLKRGGQYISPVFPLPPSEALDAVGATGLGYGILPNRERLEQVRPIIEAGDLRISVEREFPLSEVLAALEQSKMGRTKGKLLVVPALG